MSALLRLSLVFAVVAMIPSNAQRSPYVPQPWNYPGLLPRFGEQDNSAPIPASTQRPRPAQRPQFESNDLGNRIGNRAPCVECYVYITRNGETIRVNRGDVRF